MGIIRKTPHAARIQHTCPVGRGAWCV